MIGRCTNPANRDYPQWGGRGIRVCDRWLNSYDAFVADVPPRPNGTSIDRIDNSGDYEPGNVRWATPTEQARNTRSNRLVTFQGETMTIADWGERLGVNRITLAGRMRRMSDTDALSMPPNPRKTLTHDGQTLSLAQWAAITGVARQNIYNRIYTYGWTAERALTTP